MYFNEHNPEWLTDEYTLKPEYDAVHVNMGGSWRMPTSAEMRELADGTTWSFETLSGVKGMRFTSKSNGNSIFMPFAGYLDGSDAFNVGDIGYAWSSSLYAGNDNYSNYLAFINYGKASVYNNYRYYGFVARGVRK